MFNLTELPQSDLVSIDESGKTTTTSLKIAELFDKRHSDVLRDIEQILTQVSDSFQQRNFALSQYAQQMPTGGIKNVPMYQLTESGFSMLVMGYTGSKAIAFKERFITEFMNMREFVETKRDEYERYLEHKNQQLISHNTEYLTKVENKTRTLVSQAINLDCDLNMYRSLLREKGVFDEQCAKSKRRPASSKTSDNVRTGELEHIFDSLEYRLEYEEKLADVRYREIELRYRDLQSRPKYFNPKVEEYTASLTLSILGKQED